MKAAPWDPMAGSPLLWVIGFVLVLGLLWLLFSIMAKSDRSRGRSGTEGVGGDVTGPSGAAWVRKHPDAEEGPDEHTMR